MHQRLMARSGFSLVELIVTIAIIGILASIVVPNYGKFSFRAKLAEGKIQLSAIYSAEKAFYASYGAYHSSFPAIGYSPEGNVRFNTGFQGGAGGGEAGPANGFTTALTPAQQAAVNTLRYCKDALGGPGLPGNSCNTLLGSDANLPPTLADGFVVFPLAYYAGAVILVPTVYAFGEPHSILSFNQAHAMSPPPLTTNHKFYGLGMSSKSKAILEVSCEQDAEPPPSGAWGIALSHDSMGDFTLSCGYSM